MKTAVLQEPDKGSRGIAGPSAPPPPPQLPALWLVCWLTVAAAVPIFVALLGVCARYLQVTTTPPFPPLRFTAVLNVFAFPTLLLLYTLPRCLLTVWQHRRQRQRQLQSRGSGSGAEAGAAAVWAEGCAPDALGGSTSGDGSKRSGDSYARHSAAQGITSEPCTCTTEEPAALSGAVVDPPAGQADGAAAAPPAGPSLPGLAWLRRRHPAAHGVCVLLVVAFCYEVAILGQNVAPGLVDPAVVMLVSMFTVVGVAVLSWLWLRAPLRWAVVVPTAAVMIGGAAMVLAPDIQAGGGESGSLTTQRAWLGFGASVGAMLGNALFIVLAQAYKDADLSASKVQYTIIVGYNICIVLPISLGVDGADWGPQFAGMGPADWGALWFCVVAHAFIAILIQESTVRLGGMTVSMFFGLRLIGSVVGSKAVLGVTIVQTGVQVAGVVLVVVALSVYTAIQWRLAARQRRLNAPAQQAGAGGGVDAG